VLGWLTEVVGFDFSTTCDSLFVSTFRAQAKLMHRLRPRFASTTDSVGSVEVFVGVVVFLMPINWAGKGGLGVVDIAGLVKPPSLVNSAVDTLLKFPG
jgi:hypothetical protein